MTTTQKQLLLVTRLLFGILFLWSGLDKFISGFTAKGYLTNAVSGPFADIFSSMSGSYITDFLVIYGEIAIGLALITGTFIRFTALMGSLMMTLFYLSSFPPENGLISQHIIYILVFKILAVFNAGRIYGVDFYLEEMPFVKKNYKLLRYLLG